MRALRIASLTLCAAALLFGLGSMAVGIYMVTRGFVVGAINISIGAVVVAVMGASASLILRLTRPVATPEVLSVDLS